MKQLFFDIDSEQEIDKMKEVLTLLLNIDGIPTPKIVISDVPDWFVINNE